MCWFPTADSSRGQGVLGKVEIHTNCLAAVPNILLHTKLEPMHCSIAEMWSRCLVSRGWEAALGAILLVLMFMLCWCNSCADAGVDVYAVLMQQLLLILMLVLLMQRTDVKPLSGFQGREAALGAMLVNLGWAVHWDNIIENIQSFEYVKNEKIYWKMLPTFVSRGEEAALGAKLKNLVWQCKDVKLKSGLWGRNGVAAVCRMLWQKQTLHHCMAINLLHCNALAGTV